MLKNTLTLFIAVFMLFGCTRVTESKRIFDNSVNSVILIQTPTGIGTGFFIDKNLIITNYHVVKNAPEYKIHVFQSMKSYDVNLVSFSEDHDIALLEIKDWGTFAKEQRWKIARLNATAPNIGSSVYAIGHPWGLSWSISSGIISNNKRFVQDKPVIFLQTSAKVYQGNSGGPLIDSDGQVVGMNTMMLSNEGGSYGFSIPSRYLKKVVNELRKYKKTTVVKLGVVLGVSEDKNFVIIKEIKGKSVAEKCGFKVDDRILGISYENKYYKIREVIDLYDSLFTVGMDTITLGVTIKRSSEKKQLTCKIK